MRALGTSLTGILYPSSTFWNGSGLFVRPSIMTPSVKQGCWNSIHSCYFAPGNAIGALLNKATVDGLGFARSPSAVIGRVSAIDINPLYCQTVQIAITHSPFTEDGKRIPFLANIYTSAAIVCVAFVRWIKTALSHRLPYIVQWRSTSSVSPGGCVKFIHSVAPTISGFSVSKVCSCWFSVISALAFTKPNSRTTSSITSLFYDQPFSEPLSGQID